MRKTPHADDIIKLYKAFVPMQEIADRLGVSIATVHRHLRARGVSALTRKERSELGLLKSRCGITPGISDEIVARYADGMSANAISKAVGISRNAVNRELTKRGVQIRGQSEAEAAKWKIMRNIEGAVERQCRAAWDAARGRFDSIESRCARAISTQAAGNKIFRHETDLAVALADFGFPCTQQLAVGPYNLDIAINEFPVAVEVIGAPPWEFTKTKLRDRTEYLLDRGWFVVFVRYHRRIRPVIIDHAAEQLVAYLDLARKDKTVFGKYGMVIGHPEYSPTSRYDLDGLPFVPRPLNS